MTYLLVLLWAGLLLFLSRNWLNRLVSGRHRDQTEALPTLAKLVSSGPAVQPDHEGEPVRWETRGDVRIVPARPRLVPEPEPDAAQPAPEQQPAREQQPAATGVPPTIDEQPATVDLPAAAVHPAPVPYPAEGDQHAA